jgi:homoserine dehydrogenase
MVVDPAVQAQALTQSVGEEVTRMIVEQKELEQRFEQLISAQHVLRTMPNKSKLRQNQQEVAEVAEKLRQSTKQLCRNLKDNPNVTENMAKVAAERVQLQALLSKCLNELEVLREMPCVVNMVRAEDQKEVETKETIQREKVRPSLPP